MSINSIKFQSSDTFKRLFALIGENGQGIGTSAFADWVKNATALDLPADRKAALDDFIDHCYADMDESKFAIRSIVWLISNLMGFLTSHSCRTPVSEQRGLSALLDWKQG